MTKHKQAYRSGIFPGLLLSVVCLFLLPSCHNDPDDIRALMGGGGRQTDKADTVTVIYSKDGHIKVKLYGREFFRNESAKPAYIDMNRDIKAIFYDDSGHQDQILTADSARYYTGQGNALVWDSVHVATRKGEQLNTDELVWNESVQQFFTEKPVKITTPTEVLYGKGLESNSDFSNYKILSPTGTVQVNKGEVPQ